MIKSTVPRSTDSVSIKDKINIHILFTDLFEFTICSVVHHSEVFLVVIEIVKGKRPEVKQTYAYKKQATNTHTHI